MKKGMLKVFACVFATICIIGQVRCVQYVNQYVNNIINNKSEINDYKTSVYIKSQNEELSEPKSNNIINEKISMNKTSMNKNLMNKNLMNKNLINKNLTTETTTTNASTTKTSTTKISSFKKRWAYNTLSKDEKLLYREMYTALINHKKSVKLTTKNLDIKDLYIIENVYYAIDADNPEIFWCDGYTYRYYKMGDKIVSIQFEPKYTYSKKQCKKYQKAIDKNVKIILSGITDKMSDYDKSKYIYDTIIKNVDYDKNAKDNQTIVSSLTQGKTVCKGYAKAMQYLLRKVGIESVIVSGKVDKESHAWNIVKLDGDWYHLDATWGNSRYLSENKKIGKYINYNYLNVTDKQIKLTHSIKSTFRIPKCNTKKYNYFIKEDKYISKWDIDKINAIIKNALLNNNKQCYIKFSNKKLYNKFIANFIEDVGIWDCIVNVPSCGYSSYVYIKEDETNTILIEFRN